MKSNFKKLPSSIVELEVELTKDEFDEYLKETKEQALSKVEIKGFRPGAAPKELAERAIDEEKVFEIAASDAVKRTLDEVVQENEWTLISHPQAEVISRVNGLKYKSRLTLFPEIKLADYKKIAHKIAVELSPKLEELKVEQEEIDKSLEWLLTSRGKTTADLNDKFAQDMGVFKNVAELRDSVKKGLLLEKKTREEQKMQIKILEEIAQKSDIDPPEVMIGKMTKKDLLNHLVVYKIAQEENLKPTEEEIETEVEKHRHLQKSLDNKKFYDYIYNALQNKKVLEFLEKQ